MFHVLTKGSVPPYLSAGYDGATESTVLCGARVGARREAITYERCNTLHNSGNLRVERICKPCAKNLGIRVQREKKNV